MGLNKPKRAWMSLEISSNEPKWAQSLLKFLLVMHINVRHDICYDFSSDITNVKNKERIVSVVHFHKAFRPRSLALFDLRPLFCNKWNTSWRYTIQLSFLKTAILVLIEDFLWNTPLNTIQFLQRLCQCCNAR